MQIVGVVLVALGLLSLVLPNMTTTKPYSSSPARLKTQTPQTVSKVHSVPTTKEIPASQEATPAPVSDNPTPTSAQHANTTAPPADTPSKNVVTQPAAVPTYVTGATVTILNGCAGSYKYTVSFFGSTSFTFSAQWEIVSGAESYDFGTLDSLPSGLPMAGSAFLASVSSISDTKSPGLAIYTGHPYEARIHVVSPSDFYSNTVSIPDSCQ